jgi:hypothetical protein
VIMGLARRLPPPMDSQFLARLLGVQMFMDGQKS